MPEAAAKPDLLVFEYGGSARSGKGTIVEHLAAERPGVAKDETGLYYRKLTLDFLNDGKINPDMPSGEIIALLSDVPVEHLEGMLVGRDKWGSGEERKSLYGDSVNRLVADVGQVPNARKAVKSGFARRIRSLVKAGDHRAVVIDGRNLSGVVSTIEGARMVLRTFVDCQPYEAALRECSRNNIKLNSPEGQQILADIEQRNRKDRTRREDPMVIDPDAIDFWHGSEAESEAQLLRNCNSSSEYLTLLQDHKERLPIDYLPHGAGSLAVLDRRQILLDTTPFRLFENPVEAMLTAAEQMFDEAMAANKELMLKI